MQAAGDHQAPQQVFELPPVNLAKSFHRHDPFEKTMLADPRMPDAGAFPFPGRGEQEEAAPGKIKVPGDETESVRSSIEVKIKVLPVREEAVVIGQQDLDREIA